MSVHCIICTAVKEDIWAGRMLSSESENFCLKWNDFVANITDSFAHLHKDKDFSDVTLASADGPQFKSHRIILASGSLVFKNLLEKNLMEKPLIFMRGVKSDHLSWIVDFLYKGEVNIDQENLNEFLALAEDLQLKGLTETGGGDVKESLKPQELNRKASRSLKPVKFSSNNENMKAWGENRIVEEQKDINPGGVLSVIQDFQTAHVGNKSGVTFQDGFGDLEMEIGKLMKKVDGNGWSCVACGKTDKKINIKKHIEGHHIEKRDHFCNMCGKHCTTRNALQRHMSTNHR